MYTCLHRFSYSGMIREFDTVKVGPNETGRFIETQVTSIHRYRLPCRLIRTGQAATLSLKDIDRTAVRKVKRTRIIKLANPTVSCGHVKACMLPWYGFVSLSREQFSCHHLPGPAPRPRAAGGSGPTSSCSTTPVQASRRGSKQLYTLHQPCRLPPWRRSKTRYRRNSLCCIERWFL